jgi:type VI secretion system protein ImpC
MPRESLQKKLGRVRPPRVRITYQVETGDAIEIRDLPFVVGVFADLSGQPLQRPLLISQRRFVAVDRDNLDAVLRATAPRVSFTVANHLDPNGPELLVELTFQTMYDFAPDRIAGQIPVLSCVLDVRTALGNLRRTLLVNDRLEETIAEILSDPEALSCAREELHNLVSQRCSAIEDMRSCALASRLVASARIGGTAGEEIGSLIGWLKVLLDEAAMGRVTFSTDVEKMLGERIRTLDELLSRQMDEVMHAEPMQRLEASWRGLAYLVQQSETSSHLKIKIFNASKAELAADLEKASTVKEAAVFDRIFSESFGPGGELFGVFVGDFEFGRDPADVLLLEKFANIAAWWNAPFISAAAPAMFRFESFTELAGPCDLEKIFHDALYSRWHVLRRSETARYIGLCLPRVLMRIPYGEDNPVEQYDYRESISDHAGYLWGNAAYIFATRLTDAFARYGWCASIRGVEGGGSVEGLPFQPFRTDEGDVVSKCPTEIAITDRREAELAGTGFIPLCYYKGADVAVFMAAPSAQKPQLYLDDEANANARLSSQLPYIFACSRFAHFMKKLVRDRIGGFPSAGDSELFLNRWISQYVLLDDVAPQEARARFPLREARVQVGETPGEPNTYRAVVFLRPHFQLDEMAVSLRLVVPLPSMAST